MRVKLLKGSHRPDRNIAAGDVVDLPPKEARPLLDRGLAVEADERQEQAPRRTTAREAAAQSRRTRSRKPQARKSEPAPVSGESAEAESTED